MQNKKIIASKFAFCLCLSVLLSACVSKDISDIEAEVSSIMSRKGERIEPLPEIKHYEAYTYSSKDRNAPSPFKLFYVTSNQDIVASGEVIDDGLTEEMENEIRNRNREELEQFALDSLRMVGFLENEDNNWAIILAPDGVVHRVSVGNYMGSNIGKIVNIFEDKLDIREIIQDGSGRWAEREATLVLVEGE